jgi:hypothetical protein
LELCLISLLTESWPTAEFRNALDFRFLFAYSAGR